jgi:hypothetical protein
MTIINANEIYKKLSSQIESQFPGFIREDGPQFVAFLKAYYEYLEQNGNAVNAIRQLNDNQDVDRTLDSFVEYFRNEFMQDIPKDALADQRLLTKHIRQFYRSRGTPESYRFLFRALYNKEIEFYYPGEDILRVSDGRWLKESKLRVGSPFNTLPSNFGGIKVTGATSGATAVVQSVISTIASGVTVFDMTVENVSGAFQDNERIFDADGNFATVNAQIGALTALNIIDGGAFHNNGEEVEIGGAGSTVNAKGIITEVTNRSAATVRLVKSGSGYTRNNTRVVITGGNGSGLSVGIHSFTQEAVSISLNNDIINNLKNVRLDSPSFFVRSGANTGPVTRKLTGTVKAFTGTNTIFGQGTTFNTQLAVGDIVRVTGSPTALRVHSIGGAQTFVTVTRSSVGITTGANAYSKLAAANVSSTLQSALTFNTSSFFSINALSLINPGKGYTTLPTISIVDDDIAMFGHDDGYGGILGKNAVVVSNVATGSIVSVRIVDRGTNFNKFQEATVLNITRGNDQSIQSYAARKTDGSATTRYTVRQTTHSGLGFGQVSGVTNYPGKYIDSKGFLSWNNRLQDNYYYQEFSYVIRVTELLDKYKEVVKKLVHPSGTKLFGEYQIISNVLTPIQVVSARSSFITLNITETLTPTDVSVGMLNTSAAIVELSGSDIIGTYASDLISVYASSLISDIGGIGTLKLLDSIEATIS